MVQEPQLGTAHALMTTADGPRRSDAACLILLSGDVPLLSTNTLKTLVERHSSTGAAATVVTAIVDNPHGYGRIVRASSRPADCTDRRGEGRDGRPSGRSARSTPASTRSHSTGCADAAATHRVRERAAVSITFPDLVAVYRQAEDRTVETVTVSNPDEIRGINSRRELAAVSSNRATTRKAAELMDSRRHDRGSDDRVTSTTA